MQIRYAKMLKSKQFRPLALIFIVSAYLSQIRSEGTHNMSYYILWAKSIVDGQLLEIYHATPDSMLQNSESLTVPYTPLSQYLTAGTSWILLHFLPNERATYVTAVNFTCVLFTLLTALIFFLNRRNISIKSPLIYLATPAVFLISPLLAYEDSIMSFFLVVCLVNLSKERYFLAGLLGGCAVFSKQLALMPLVGIFLLILYSKKFLPTAKFVTGSLTSSFVILSPFIFSGSTPLYFKAQSLTSVHTMLSAQAANFPWLGSLFYRCLTLGPFDGFIEGGNGLRISNDELRQISYLSSGLATILAFTIWAIFWGRRIGTRNLNPIFGAAVMIFSYHLFNFGVHENHIFMLIPILFLISQQATAWSSYKMASGALALTLVSAYGLGQESSLFTGFSSSHPFLYSSTQVVSLVLYLLAFIKILRTDPSNNDSSSYFKVS